VVDSLKNAIRDGGRVEGDLVMVDDFLNHRIDVRLMAEIGEWLADRLGPCDAIVTSEASGIAPALTTAIALDVPLVFAKKRPVRPEGPVSREVHSPSKGDRPWLSIAPRALGDSQRLALVDDFLSAGRTALALVEMLREAGREVGKAGFCIEKAYAGGRVLLEAAGIEVVAAAVVEGIVDGRPVVS
jgi:xanthine phosphoribosyltransferase